MKVIVGKKAKDNPVYSLVQFRGHNKHGGRSNGLKRPKLTHLAYMLTNMWQKTNTVHSSQHTVPMVKAGSSSFMLWGCSSAETRKLVKVQRMFLFLFLQL
ncbi:hypothetical protein XENOCAPTIV_017448 [Xenoophorus captivus]|uniref:Uncharacterized protein n=1 Tax=Xenoophorus captivus TaxID=1517983 RepID=A0ABV0S020_9TELE